MSVRYGLLAALERRSMYGYEIRRELEDELGPDWVINYGQIYSTLERLVRDGMVVQTGTVSSADAPDRKLYTVTPAGRADLRRWFLSPVEGLDTSRDELYAKVVLGLTGDVDIEDVIQAQRKGQLRRIGLLTEAKERCDPEVEITALLQLNMAIMKADAAVRWLDDAEARIRRATTSQVRAAGHSTASGRSAGKEPIAGRAEDKVPVREVGDPLVARAREDAMKERT